MLELKAVSKTYKKSKAKAIDSINLKIEDGDIYGFIGPNGAGKSTTIKCITGSVNKKWLMYQIIQMYMKI